MEQGKNVELTEENYFSKEMEQKYTGSTQIKSFLKCEESTLAQINGEYEKETSDSMLVSSYLDEKISGTLDKFIVENPEMFTKQGDLKAPYKHVEEIYEKMLEPRNAMFMKYLSGEKQVIMTGEISGVPVKIKIDSYHEGKCIVDLKCIKDLNLIWNNDTKQKENFIDYYDYILQGAIYQEIVRQNTGLQLPFIIAVATKEKEPQFALLQIPQEKMDFKLEFLKSYLPHIQQLKEGKAIPTSCNSCEYCVSKKEVNQIFYYDDFFRDRG